MIFKEWRRKQKAAFWLRIGIPIGFALIVLSFQHCRVKLQIKRIEKQLRENTPRRRSISVELFDRNLESLTLAINSLIGEYNQMLLEAGKKHQFLKGSIADISHDMRTPLTSIIGYLQLLNKGDLELCQRQHLNIALEKSQFLRKLLEDFYELSTLSANDSISELKKVDLAGIVSEVILENANEFAQREITPTFELSDKPIFILSINDLLTDIYGSEKRVSAILAAFGLEQGHINQLKGEKLSVFYENIKFALECRFIHYSGGYRLLDILYRRYGLFGHKRESLEEIGDSMGVSRERVRQLQNKAIKRMVGGVSADATSILLFLCACHTLGLNAMDYHGNGNVVTNVTLAYTKNLPDETKGDESDVSEDILEQEKPINLPKAAFYFSGGFDYKSGHGEYRMLIECGEHKKYIEEQDLEGHSDVNMILLAVIAGLEMLKKPFDITVYSNTLFGVSNIYDHGVLREAVPSKASNYDLKEKIRLILKERGHYLFNITDNDIKTKMIADKISENSDNPQ